MHVRTHVIWMFACMYICIYVCMYVYMYVCINVFARSCAFALNMCSYQYLLGTH